MSLSDEPRPILDIVSRRASFKPTADDIVLPPEGRPVVERHHDAIIEQNGDGEWESRQHRAGNGGPNLIPDDNPRGVDTRKIQRVGLSIEAAMNAAYARKLIGKPLSSGEFRALMDTSLVDPGASDGTDLLDQSDLDALTKRLAPAEEKRALGDGKG